jgi:AraC family transcriptional regulator
MRGRPLANMADGWNREPSLEIETAGRSGLAAALWTQAKNDVQEVESLPDTSHINISLVLSPLYAELWQDGHQTIAKQVRPGHVTFINPGVKPRAIHRGSWKILHLWLPMKVFSTLLEDEQVPAASVQFIDPRCAFDQTIERIGRSILSEMQDGAILSRLKIDLLGLELGVHLLRQHSSLPRQDLEPATTLAPWQVTRVLDFMSAGLAKNSTLAEIASLVRLSPFHFARCFKQSTGLPPHRYLIQLRIEKAKELLEHTALPITEIAAQVGYEDPGYFSRLFLKEAGVSPSQYRRDRRS